MDKENQPLVSVGIPVYNGEKGLARALDSVLGQGYRKLEIIISDNGSTDTTQEICGKYAQQDSRIKYFRSEKNLGGIWNFNQVFKLSTGKYFMWAAHDDILEKSFVEECVVKMEKNPDAVLCHSHTAMYLGEEMICLVSLDSFSEAKDLVDRFQKVREYPPAAALYGLYRSSAMRKTGLFQKILGGELCFLQELSIYGDFIQVSKILFNYINREKWNDVNRDYYVLFGKKEKPWWYFPFLILFFNHCGRVLHSNISLSLKFRLWGVLSMQEIRQGALKVLIKAAGRICPERLKKKVGSAIYWRWIHSPDIEVRCEDLYLERIIMPKLGWWN